MPTTSTKRETKYTNNTILSLLIYLATIWTVDDAQGIQNTPDDVVKIPWLTSFAYNQYKNSVAFKTTQTSLSLLRPIVEAIQHF